MKKTLFLSLLLVLPLASCQGSDSSTSTNTSFLDSSLSSAFESSSDSSISGSLSSASSSESSSTSSSRPDGDGIVTLYSVNDFHGKIEQDSQYPGLLALQGAIKSDARYESSSLFFSAGDMWQGSYVSGYDKGESTTKLMNLFPFSAMALGNHEFDWGIQTIQSNIEAADFPLLCANLVEEETGARPDWIQDHAVFEVEGHKLGIVGAIGADLESDIKASRLEGYSFTNSKAVLNDSYEACLDEGAEMVLLLLHDDEDSGYTNFIQNSGIGFSAIFGGHSHQFQFEEDATIPYVQGGADSKGYSYIQLDFNRKEVVSFGYEHVRSDYSSLADDLLREAVQEVVDSVPIETLGYIQGNWTREETAALVVKAMFDAAVDAYPERKYTESNLIAAHNTGGVRAEFPDSSSVYPVTMMDIQLVSPFDNEVWVLPDKRIDADGMRYNYCYPDASSLDGSTADVVLIDFLLDMYHEPMYESTGGKPLTDAQGEPLVIYDIIADFISENSSMADPLRASDFR